MLPETEPLDQTPERTASLPTPRQSPDNWGPLAVVPAPPISHDALMMGRLRITDKCAFVEADSRNWLLLWPSDRVAWDPGRRVVLFHNPDGTRVELLDGLRAKVGGDGKSGEDLPEDWADSIDWIERPDASCPLEARWMVAGFTD